MKQTVTIEVDVPDGFEAVRFGIPAKGDSYISAHLSDGEPFVISPGRVDDVPRLIVRPIWQPPTWLKPGWIAMDPNGQWYHFITEPHIKKSPWADGGEWLVRDCDWQCLTSQWKHIDFTPPPCTDWRQSLRRIGGES